MRIAAVAALGALAVAGHAAYQDDWGPPVGAPLAAFDVPDQTGAQRDLAGLAGERGVLVFFVRSAEW